LLKPISLVPVLGKKCNEIGGAGRKTKQWGLGHIEKRCVEHTGTITKKTTRHKRRSEEVAKGTKQFKKKY